jgi:uncharacterized protein YggE
MEPAASSFSPKRLLLIVTSIIFIVLVWIYVSSPLIVTVTGVGEVSVPATNATLSFTLSANDQSSPQSAVSNVNAKALALRTFLQSKGIAEGDIAESQVTAVPSSLITEGTTGYQATISMAAKTTHVSDVSLLISDLYSQGALVVSQPILSIENQNTVDQQAFDQAMKDARQQAGSIGNKNWKFLRKIISISQVSSPTTSTATTKADTLTSANDAIAAENGVFKIVKAVSVTYKMW